MARKMRKRTKRKITKAIFSIILVLILSVAGYIFKDQIPGGFLGNDATVGGPLDNIPAVTDPNYLTVHYIDVGQADAILVACGGEYMLIDAGEDDGDDRVIHYLTDLGIDEIDLVVATHAHSDHIGEMGDVLNAIPAVEVWYPEYRHGTKTALHRGQRRAKGIHSAAKLGIGDVAHRAALSVF